VKRATLLIVAAITFGAPRVASADIVRLTSGATLSVKSAVVDGDTLVLTLRAGGEMRAPRTLVAEILPDEVLHADAATTFVLPSLPPPAALAAGGDLRGMIDRLAAQFGVQADLAHALIRVESNYQPTAVSSKGAMGLMQLMPLIARHYSVSDPFDPEQNVTAGLQHLKGLLDRFDNTATALAAYNAGETAVARYGGIPPFRETQDYVRRILTLTRKP
jgi:soluble lytic murein transglycosylase-like protein